MDESNLIEQKTSSTARNWEWLVPVLLVLILLFGAIVRLAGLDWDEDQHLHPDERFLTMVSSALSLPGSSDAVGPLPAGCDKWGDYFDTNCSPLNPYNHNFGLFVYGTFPIFLTRLLGQFIDQTGYGQVFLVGRALSALFDLSTVLLIFFIGRRLYGVRAALLGALFLAGSVLDIQQSHFYTVDTFTNVPILLAFWYAMDLADGKKWHAFLYAGAAFGFALAGRINIVPFAAVLVAAGGLRAYLAADASRRAYAAPPETATGLPAAPPRPSLIDWLWGSGTRAFFGLAGAALVALLVFRVAQPYAANGPNFLSPSVPHYDSSQGAVGFLFDVALSWAGGVNPKFADNMQYIGQLVSGQIDFPPGHQWTDRAAYVFPFENMVLWGLGLPLGLVAWAGFLLALYRLVRYREWQHLLIVVWVGITFGYSGQQFVKTMRYFLQIYPFLALLAGYFLVALWDKVREANFRPLSTVLRPMSQVAVGIVALVVIGYTLFWATAFMTIYTRPVSRVTASRWIFANVPRGSIIGNEHWDDPLPLRVDNLDPYGGLYRGLSSSQDGVMHWYDEDTPEKRIEAIKWLDEAQYLVLSSNRLYLSIPRLPMRYPLTTKYYQWLFDGTLGFENVATITSRPQLFGIEINDDNAEEAFTVYDHPKVLIFMKTAAYSHDLVTKLFNSVDLTEVYRFTPLQASQNKTALVLKPSDWDAQMTGGTWSDIFHPDDLINRIPVVVWLALVEILGWLALPFAFFVFSALADRGYIFAKGLGILLPAWAAWMLASFHLVPFGRLSIALGIAFVLVISGLVVWRRGRELLAFVRAHRGVLLVEELLFLLCFGVFLLIRYGNPDLWHPYFGGEKPMDFAILNAVIKSTWMPPYDAWFAGGYLNYYYFGQFITATLTRFTGIVPEVAYNLALPMFFAMTALGAFSVAFNLAARRTRGQDAETSEQWRFPLFAGVLAAIFVAFIGNLGQVILIAQALVKTGGGDPQGELVPTLLSGVSGLGRVVLERLPLAIPPSWWYWNASRVIPDTINEFPFFSFTYADLHAHLMALPFTLIVLGLAVNFVRREPESAPGETAFRWLAWFSPADIVEVVVAGLVLGALRAINYADFATYQLVIASALAIGAYARRGRIDLAGIFGFAWRVVAVFVLATVLWQPFVSNFATAYLNVEVWNGARTTLGEYLTVYGIFLFVLATYLIWQTFDTKASRGPFRFLRMAIVHSNRLEHMLALHRVYVSRPSLYEDLASIIVVGALVIEGVLIVAQWFVFALVFPFLVLAGLLVLRPNLDPARRLIALLVAAGLALTLTVEVVVYKGDIGRMNTVFKFYLQVWVLFGVASAAALALVLQTQDARRRMQVALTLSTIHRPSAAAFPLWWWGIFALLVFAGLLYPVTAARAKVEDRFVADSPPGLNGLDYMRTAVYSDAGHDLVLEYDREAIEWLRANVKGSPVILEGNAPLYRWGSRIANNTGLPTVIGWDWHQKQQRSIIDPRIIDERVQTANDIYNTPDANSAIAMLSRFRVKYIYVGDMERLYYNQVGLAKFDLMAGAGTLQVVYQNEHVKIYEIKE
ncbi:MAG TPA: DUF2298 domain-containing protein [Anaerolineae bacterium]